MQKIRAQLRGEADHRMEDVDAGELLNDINTDVMTPAWVCFRHRPEDIALDAYAGLLDEDGERVFETRALMDGGFDVIVSGQRKGTGSSRETAPQAERWSGVHLIIAASFAPIHERNNVNLGQLMGSYEQLERMQAGEEIPLSEFTDRFDPITRAILESGGLFAFVKAWRAGEVTVTQPIHDSGPMTMAEKIIASRLASENGGHVEGGGGAVKPGDACLVRVDGGYSHEFTSAQVHHFLLQEYGDEYTVVNPDKLAVFEDHLVYAGSVARFSSFMGQVETLRQMQTVFQAHTAVRDYSALDGVSPGICHQIAREDFIDPGDFILATDSHTCMGGGNNALAWGVGATEYANLIQSGVTFVEVPESIRFELTGSMPKCCTAKDLMLFILREFAVPELTLNRVMEFGGAGLRAMDMDERATLTNMATECSARSAIAEGDALTAEWIANHRPGTDAASMATRFVSPDPDAHYGGGVHTIDLTTLVPMVAEPGDPTNGRNVDEIGTVSIDIAYAGSCTAGKETDMDLYASVLAEAHAAGLRVADGTRLVIQTGSTAVAAYARKQGYTDLFVAVGAEVISPGCGACIGCGPGVSESPDQVTVSAINRNFQGRSGPGSLYIASPLTVAASAILGQIAAWEPGMFQNQVPADGPIGLRSG
jgi:3-isopropylmalate/(R)-2-methylmalate dehydratase large subunit